MQFSEAGFDLLKRSEGFRGHVYLDVGGLPTIGYGHRLLHPDSFVNGIDQDQAQNLLVADVNNAAGAVQRLVRVPLKQGQFDALVDFTFNMGVFRLAGSTLL
ncbi:MAG: lysozyme, partial [Terracidiphilus sp.]